MRSAADDPSAGGKRILRHATSAVLWSVLELLGNRVVGFVLTLIMTRLVAPDAFGVVAAGMTIITYLDTGLDLGAGAAVIYEQEEGVTRRVRTAVGMSLALSGALALIGVLCAPFVASFFHVPHDAGLFRLLFLVLPVRGVGHVGEAVLRRDLRFRARTLVGFARASVRMAVSVPLALAGKGALAIIVGYVVAEATSAILGWIVVGAVPVPAFDRLAAGSMVRFGSAVMSLRLLAEVGANADYLVVGNRLGATQLGFYSIAFRLPELIIGGALWVYSSIAFPIYSRARELGMDALRSAMLRALTLVTTFGFTTGVGLALVARDVVPFVFSPKWEPAVGPMQLIALALGAGAIGYASGDIFPAIGRPGLLLAVNAPLSAAGLLGFLLAAPHGIVVVASVHLVLNVVYGVVRMAIANRVLGTTMAQSVRAMAPALAMAGSMGLFGVVARVLTSPGTGALVIVALAGAAGGLAAFLVVGGAVRAEVVALARARRRPAPAGVEAPPGTASGGTT